MRPARNIGCFVRSEKKCEVVERELMTMRRRTAEREAAFEQQRTDASELSVQNRMLVEKTEQMVIDAQRTLAKRNQVSNLARTPTTTCVSTVCHAGLTVRLFVVYSIA